MIRLARPLAAALCLFTALSAYGAEKAPECGPIPAPPPAELAAWSHPLPGDLVAGAALAAGKAVQLALKPEAGLALPAVPGKAGRDGTFAGLYSLSVDRPGLWRVALGKAAWIDIVRDGAAIASVGHGHGPACTGIRKIVDFNLMPGRYLIQLSASPAQDMTALVLPPA